MTEETKSAIPMDVDEPARVITVAPKPVTVKTSARAGVTVIRPSVATRTSSNVVLTISTPSTQRLVQAVPKIAVSSQRVTKPTYQVVRLVTPAQQKHLLHGQVAPVRLLTTSSSGAASSRIQIVPTQTVSTSALTNIKPQPGTVLNKQQRPVTSQRLLLPATQSLIAPQLVTIPFSQTAPKLQTVLTTGQPTATVIAPQPGTNQQVLAFLSPQKSAINQQAVRVVAHSAPSPSKNARIEPAASSSDTKQELSGIKKEPSADSDQRKPCNCTKSHCLKLYCDCFAKGEFCRSNCNCVNCSNILSKEDQRQKAIKQCLLRNPNAFHPKIGKGESAQVRRHQKGCNCKRSGCLKNYCECFEAKIMCGALCKCVGCKNCEENVYTGGVSLMSLADAAMVRTVQLSSDRGTKPSRGAGSGRVHTHNNNSSDLIKSHLTTSVIEGVLDCLIAQCHEAEAAKCNPETTQKLILEEFGRCATRIIHSSSTDSS